MRVLFICKAGSTYGPTYHRKSSGLFNSTRYIVESLKSRGVHSKIVDVVDNNDIDREVTEFKPSIVVIEALWVVPEKFDILKKLHRRVKWFVHIHSNIPFLAMEGIAMEWIHEYQKRGVKIIANSKPAFDSLSAVFGHITFLPNVYIPEHKCIDHNEHRDHVNIACYGAIRPLKNQLIQAMAAIKFAKDLGKTLYFYINATRIEQGGNPVLKNIIDLFSNTPKCYLVQRKWVDPKDFRRDMSIIDIGMQVSLSETFNVVTADYVSAGVPVVVSKEISWVSRWNQCETDDINDIVDKMHRSHRNQILVKWNQLLLTENSHHAQNEWYKFIKAEVKSGASR